MIVKDSFKVFILPTIILFFSFLNLWYNFDLNHVLSIIISIVGLVGVVLFLSKKEYYSIFFQTWIISQIPLISLVGNETLENGVDLSDVTLIFWNAQYQTFPLMFNLGLSTGKTLNIGVNFLPFLYLALFKITATVHLIGMKIELSRTGGKGKFINSFPLSGTIIKRVEIGKEKDWLYVELDSYLEVESAKTKNGLIRPKGLESYSKKKAVISFFRFALDEKEMHDKVDEINDYRFYDWVFVKLK